MNIINLLYAFSGVVVGLICLIAIVPVISQLIPFLSTSFGALVVTLVSTMVLLIVIGIFFNLIQDAQNGPGQIGGFFE